MDRQSQTKNEVASVNVLKRLQAEAATGYGHLAPAILDKTFKVEL